VLLQNDVTSALYSLSTVLEVLKNVTEGDADVLHLTLTASFDLCEAMLKKNCEHELKESICYALLNIATDGAAVKRRSQLAAVLPLSISKHAAYILVQLCHGCHAQWRAAFLERVRQVWPKCSRPLQYALCSITFNEDGAEGAHASRALTSSSDFTRSSIYENPACRCHYEPPSRRHSRSRSRTPERSSRIHERSHRRSRSTRRARSRSKSRSRTQQQQQQHRRHKSQSSRRCSDSMSRSSSSSRQQQQQQQQRRRESSSARSDVPSVANTTASAAPSAKWSKKQEVPTARSSAGSSTANAGHSNVALAIAAAPDAVAAIPNQVPLVSLTRNHETKAAEPPDMMDLSASEWNALKKAADSLKYDVKDKPSQLYFGKRLNLQSTQVKILCTEARVPTAPAQVLDEDEFYSIVEHIIKKAEEINYYVKEREIRVKQLKTRKNTNTNTISGSSSTDSTCGDRSSVGPTAAAVPVAVPSSSSERSMSPQHGRCSAKVKVEHDAVGTTAATAIASATFIDGDSTAAEYRHSYAANRVSDPQEHSNATTVNGGAHVYNGMPQQVKRTILLQLSCHLCVRCDLLWQS
jgi:hypothetical protein